MLSDKMEASGAYDEVDNENIFGEDTNSLEPTSGMKNMQINENEKQNKDSVYTEQAQGGVENGRGRDDQKQYKADRKRAVDVTPSSRSRPSADEGDRNRKTSTLHTVQSKKVMDDPLAMLSASVSDSNHTIDISQDVSDTIEPTLPTKSRNDTESGGRSRHKDAHGTTNVYRDSEPLNPSRTSATEVRPRQTKWARDPNVTRVVSNSQTENTGSTRAYERSNNNKYNTSNYGEDVDEIVPTQSKDSARVSSYRTSSIETGSRNEQHSSRNNASSQSNSDPVYDSGETVERRRSIKSNVDQATRKQAKYSITIPEWKRFENGTAGSMLSYLPVTSDVILYRVRVVAKRNMPSKSSNTVSGSGNSSEASAPKKPKVLQLYRSFSDFQALYAAIKEHYISFCPQQQHTIPIPPQKEWLWKDHSNPAFLENRRVLLEQWLSSVCLLEYAEDCPQFKTFMLPSKV